MIPKWLPNAITIARMVAALPLLALLVGGRYPQAFWLALIAGSTDALDGWLAKRYQCRSVIGGILDPVADKLLLSVCFYGLWWVGELPGWLMAVVLGRDLVILAGAYAWWRLQGSIRPAPTLVSKLTTVAQLLLVTLVLAHLAGFGVVDAAFSPLVWATALLTLASGADYVVRYGSRAWRNRRSRQ